MSTFENIAAFAGGVSEGVPQGLNLYEQFQQIKEKGKQRQQQLETEQFVAKLAQDGKFKTDKIGAFKELAQFKFNQGDVDTGQKILDYTTGLTKEKGTLDFMYAGTISKHDPVASIGRFNQGLEAYGIADRYKVNRQPDGKLLISGTQNGAAFNQPMTDDEYEDFLHSAINGLTLGPEKQAKIEQDERRLQGDLAVAGARVKESDADIAQSQSATAIAEANAPVERARALSAIGANQAQTARDYAAIEAEQADRPLKADERRAAIDRDRAMIRASELEAKGNELKLEAIRTGRADDEEVSKLVDNMLPELDTAIATEEDVAARTAKRAATTGLTALIAQANPEMNNYSAFATVSELMAKPDAYTIDEATGVVTNNQSGSQVMLPAAGIDVLRTIHQTKK